MPISASGSRRCWPPTRGPAGSSNPTAPARSVPRPPLRRRPPARSPRAPPPWRRRRPGTSLRTGPPAPSVDSPTARDRSTAVALGTVIAGRYTLVEVIGEGGMGSVYLASQTEPVKRQVALKLIKTGMDSKAVLARFDAERQALALMDHPNIARIYDGGVTPSGQPFFVMELVDGRAAHRVLRPAPAVGGRPVAIVRVGVPGGAARRTRRGSSTATSSPATSWSPKSMASRRRRSSTSAWPRRPSRS